MKFRQIHSSALEENVLSGALTPGTPCFFPKKMISSESVSIFPSYYCFGFTVLYCKADQSTHTFAGLSSCPYAAASWLPVMLCIVGQHHAHGNNGPAAVCPFTLETF